MKKILSLFAALILAAVLFGCKHAPEAVYLNAAPSVVVTNLNCNLDDYYAIVTITAVPEDEDGNTVNITYTNTDGTFTLTNVKVTTTDGKIFTFKETSGSTFKKGSSNLGVKSVSGTYNKDSKAYSLIIKYGTNSERKLNNNIKSIYDLSRLENVTYKNSDDLYIKFKPNKSFDFYNDIDDYFLKSGDYSYSIIQLSDYIYELTWVKDKYFILSFDTDEIDYDTIYLKYGENSYTFTKSLK